MSQGISTAFPTRPARASEPVRLAERLAGHASPLVLDGATGTELERAGLSTGLPLWSTHALLEAPECVYRIHAAYVAAGADIVTANTFRTQRRTLARASLGDADRRLTRLAVDLARLALAAVSPTTTVLPIATAREPVRECWIAGSLPPLEDCYRPDLVPADRTLIHEHERQVDLLGDAGVDLILVETMNTIREARGAARAAHRTGLPFVVSFVAWDGARLLSGESLADAAREARDLGASAVGVNCLPIANLGDCRHVLSGLGVPLLVSPNLGRPEPRTGFTRDTSDEPTRFPAAFADWLEAGAVLVGGCCGTTPVHIEALATFVRREAGAQSSLR